MPKTDIPPPTQPSSTRAQDSRSVLRLTGAIYDKIKDTAANGDVDQLRSRRHWMKGPQGEAKLHS